MNNSEADYYAVLGILPDAEDVVVVAAFRALASRYHPDRWRGDVGEATRRMADINVAFGVLGDVAKRKQYDATRASGRSTFGTRDDEQDAAFDDALNQLEDRWQVAVAIFPDLADIRANLAKTAHRLAFAFVTVILETKQFKSRSAIAAGMEKEFLERHFGTDERIVAFARELIALRLKSAIVALNNYVDVLGSGIDPERVITKIHEDFKIQDIKRAAATTRRGANIDRQDLDRIEKLKRSLRVSQRKVDAIWLANLLGYEVSTSGDDVSPDLFIVKEKSSRVKVATFSAEILFVEWVLKTLCE